MASLSDKHIIDSTNIRIIQGDFFDMNLSEYVVLFYFDKGCKEQGRLKNKIKVALYLGNRAISRTRIRGEVV